MYAPSLGYAQMRPKGVESNHFAYHLEQLLRAGLVVKNDRSYTLTTEGMALADRVSHADMSVRKQPHIVTTVCVTNEAGETALFKHAFHPYMGLLGFPQGRTHYDESVLTSAQRELFEKSGLDAVDLSHRGDVYIHATKQGVDISKILAHVFSGSVKGQPELTTVNKQKGSCSWGNADALETDQCMPGFKEIQRLLANDDGFFFAEIEAELR